MSNRIFSVTVIKKSTGEAREMNCRFRVKSAKHGAQPYSPADKNLFTVYDMKKHGYRSISMEGLKCIRDNGKTYQIVRTAVTKTPSKKTEKLCSLGTLTFGE
jgi:hypothetical protein